MKIWILCESDYDYHYNLQGFSSKEKADKALEEKQEEFAHLPKYAKPFFSVEELDVDE